MSPPAWLTWVAGAALALAAGAVAHRLGRASATAVRPALPAPPGRRTWQRLAVAGGGAAASWLLPGAAGALAPWVWIAACYLFGLSAERTGSDPGPTGRVHGEHSPFPRDRGW